MNRYLAETSEAFSLVSQLVQQNEKSNERTQVLLKEMRQFVEHDFLDFMKEDAPANSAQLFYSFLYELQRFEEFVAFPHLASKQIVGLGGAFSSGKSSFLNRLYDRKILPTHIDPTTSVPTYLLHGQDEAVQAINLFNRKIELNGDALKAISHDFQEEYSISLGHLLKSVCIQLPSHLYPNLAFLDTPGYSKPDSDDYSERTDENIAREQLNSSHMIFWFLNVEAGTFRQEDVEFLSSIKREIPIFIIVSRADKVKQENVADIVALVKKIGLEKGLNIVDVIPYSSRKPNLYPIEPIHAYLDNYNAQTTKVLFARHFKVLFTAFHSYYDEEMRLEKKRLNRLNIIALTGELEQEADESIRSLQNEIKLHIDKLKERKESLQELQHQFFTKLKEIGDIVGIPLPEPSAIDLLEDHMQSSLDIIRDYKKEIGMTKETDFVHRLEFIYSKLDNEKVLKGIQRLTLSSYYATRTLEKLLNAASPSKSEKKMEAALQSIFR